MLKEQMKNFFLSTFIFILIYKASKKLMNLNRNKITRYIYLCIYGNILS